MFSQWNKSPLAEPHDSLASFPHGGFHPTGTDLHGDPSVWQECLRLYPTWPCSDDPPVHVPNTDQSFIPTGTDLHGDSSVWQECFHLYQTWPYSDDPPVHVINTDQQGTPQHHEEHSEKSLPVDMPRHGESEPQGSVHDQAQGPVQKANKKRRRPLLSDKERAMLPRNVLELLDMDSYELLSKDQHACIAESLGAIMQARRKPQTIRARKRNPHSSRPGKKNLPELKKLAHKENKILIRDIDDERYFITPTPKCTTLPLQVADENLLEIKNILGTFWKRPAQSRDRWLRDEFLRLKKNSILVATQQQIAVQQSNETGSSSKTHKKDVELDKFTSRNIREAQTHGKAVQEDYDGSRYFFTRERHYVSLLAWQADDYSGEVNRIVRRYNRKLISEAELIAEMRNVKRAAERERRTREEQN